MKVTGMHLMITLVFAGLLMNVFFSCSQADKKMKVTAADILDAIFSADALGNSRRIL